MEINPDFVFLFNFAGPIGKITFGDWISLLTLCLAPLVAHIVAGAPRPVYLTRKRLLWHEKMCIYNPTTILWRYFAITDRRVRHKAWNAADMAASNAYFWTARGWDGSEQMMRKSRRFCTKVPPHHRTGLLSSESLKTLIIGLQGVQAMYSLVGGLLLTQAGSGNIVFSNIIAVDSIFFPLSIFGLLRLFAALWVTEEYSYADRLDVLDALDFGTEDRGRKPTTRNTTVSLPSVQSESTWASKTSDDNLNDRQLLANPKPLPIHNDSNRTLMSMGLLDYGYLETSFHPATKWQPIVLRLFYLFPLCGLLACCVAYVIPYRGSDSQTFLTALTPTTLTLVIVYIVFLSATVFIFVFYMIFRIKKTPNTTVIPCISSPAYKVYTVLLALGAIALFVVATLGTRKSACGRYTTFPSKSDQVICNGVPVSSNAFNSPFGFASSTSYNITSADNSTVTTNVTQVLPLNGWCSGSLELEDGLLTSVPIPLE